MKKGLSVELQSVVMPSQCHLSVTLTGLSLKMIRPDLLARLTFKGRLCGLSVLQLTKTSLCSSELSGHTSLEVHEPTLPWQIVPAHPDLSTTEG